MATQSAADEPKLSGFVFKIQANMDPGHRDRIAFMRLCSGRYARGMRLHHARLDKDIRIADALTFLAADRSQAEEAYAGDIMSMAGGAWEIPSDSLAMVHKNEMMLPANLAQGVRDMVDEAGLTIIRGSVGRFVGRVPLAAEAFGQFPARTDTTFDLATQVPTKAVMYRPAVASLPLPYADAVALEIEHHLSQTLEVQAAVRQRSGSQLPTVNVPLAGGPALLAATGESRYREFQFSLRKTWPNDQQFFVSYVRSASVGEVNDFGSLFTNLAFGTLDNTNANSPGQPGDVA